MTTPQPLMGWWDLWHRVQLVQLVNQVRHLNVCHIKRWGWYEFLHVFCMNVLSYNSLTSQNPAKLPRMIDLSNDTVHWF
jgi:hypothetical protein